MKITYDPKADAMSITIAKGKFYGTKEISEDTLIDLDKDGNVLSIELLDVSKRMPVKQLAKLKVSTI